MNLIRVVDVILNMDNVRHVEWRGDGTVKVYFNHDYTILIEDTKAQKFWDRLADIERSDRA